MDRPTAWTTAAIIIVQIVFDARRLLRETLCVFPNARGTKADRIRKRRLRMEQVSWHKFQTVIRIGFIFAASLLTAWLTKNLFDNDMLRTRYDTPVQAIISTVPKIQNIALDDTATVIDNVIVVSFQCTVRNLHTIQRNQEHVPGTGVAVLRKDDTGYSVEEINVGTKHKVLHEFEIILDHDTGVRQAFVAEYSPERLESKLRVTRVETN